MTELQKELAELQKELAEIGRQHAETGRRIEEWEKELAEIGEAVTPTREMRRDAEMAERLKASFDKLRWPEEDATRDAESRGEEE